MLSQVVVDVTRQYLRRRGRRTVSPEIWRVRGRHLSPRPFRSSPVGWCRSASSRSSIWGHCCLVGDGEARLVVDSFGGSRFVDVGRGYFGEAAAFGDGPLVVGLDDDGGDEAANGGVVGKVPTMSVRRSDLGVDRSSGFVDQTLRQWACGNDVEWGGSSEASATMRVMSGSMATTCGSSTSPAERLWPADAADVVCVHQVVTTPLRALGCERCPEVHQRSSNELTGHEWAKPGLSDLWPAK